MRRLFFVCAFASLLVAVGSMAWAGVTKSQSNTYKLIYDDPTVVTPGQAAAIGAALDKAGGPVGIGQVTEILKRQGVNVGRIPHIVVRPGRPNILFLLTNPAARVTVCSGGYWWTCCPLTQGGPCREEGAIK